ncbi:MAG: DUF6325 family protein [Solirubrobacterales bacterium]
MEFGPVQLLVVGFEDGKFSGEILAELRRLREHDIVRLIDLMFVARGVDGEFEAVEHSDLPADEAEAFGALAGALLGLGAGGEEGMEAGALAGAEAVDERGSVLDPDDVWYLADAIPPGTSAGIALLEHRWAIPLRDAIERAGGHSLVDAWVHPSDLVDIGAQAAS